MNVFDKAYLSFTDSYASRVAQFVLVASGLVFIARAGGDPAFRDQEGYLTGTVCLPIAMGGALIVLGCLLRGKLRRSAFWFALAAVGQAAALQMIDAGRLIHYQHYKHLGSLLTEHPLLLAYMGLQAILVISEFKPHWSTVCTWVKSKFKTWQLAGIGVIFLLTTATVSRDTSAYVAELCFAGIIQTINLVNILLIVWALPDDTLLSLKMKFDRLLGSEEKHVEHRGLDRFALVSSLWVITLAALLAWFSYERHPHLSDEVGYLYHARYFAAGMLTMPAPPVPEAFNIDLMNYEIDRWYSPVPPGWPLMLAAGVLLGVPWLVNPLLAGVNVLLTYVFLRELYDRRGARIAVLLLCVSPWYIFMSMNFMTHTFTLTCALAAAVGVARARKTGKAIWGWVAGIAIGVGGLIRPLDGLIVAGLIGLWAIGLGGRRLRVPALVGFVFGAVITGALQLPYNAMLTGHPGVFPINAYVDKYYGPNRNALGFGPERGLGWAIDAYPGHSPTESLINANLNISSINVELFGWGSGSLVFIALMLLSRTMRRSDYLMLAAVAAVVGTYSLYWFSGGPDFGARYWYLIIVPCVALTVSGIRFLENAVQETTAKSSANRARVLTVALSMCILTLLNYLPWRAIDKYFHYLRMRPDIRDMAEEYHLGKSLVLIRGDRYPDYASAAIYNPLDLNADATVYAWDRNSEVRAKVVSAYSDRPIWLVDGPTLTGRGFKVTAGPVSTTQLLGANRPNR
jgi:4-amino-4-deoxy-L-arabinose transferase-like glycosyltransferase